MVSFLSGGGAQEMTGFFLVNNLMKGKKDNNPIPASNFLLVLKPWEIDSLSFIQNILNVAEIIFSASAYNSPSPRYHLDQGFSS